MIFFFYLQLKVFIIFFFQNYMISKLQQHLKDIESAATADSLKHTLDEFIEYLLKHPEMKNKAAKVSFLENTYPLGFCGKCNGYVQIFVVNFPSY